MWRLSIFFLLFIVLCSEGWAQLTNNSADSLRDYNLRLKEYDLNAEEHKLHLEEHVLSRKTFLLTLAGIIGSGIALGFGFIQYRKAELWKRAEFLAKEMKAFFDDRCVQNVTAMIDWGLRYIEFVPNSTLGSDGYPKVDRLIQISALQPHVFLSNKGSSDAEGVDPSEAGENSSDAVTLLLETGSATKCRFTKVELQIRDSYDKFLDFLERFGSYLQSHLVNVKELNPYLRYWVEDIVEFTENPAEAAWTCALLVYIEFYGYEGVKYLFASYGFDISVNGKLFETQSVVVKDKEWISRLREACRGNQKNRD